ncbi:MIP/aquaporin family protein [Halalkalibacter krulwichiae]|uniref:Glycerol uptake facilitator protein n=1 Tax=Halalkalibacter krulwichiae TaxID=199441 RepID=A0A1X9M6N6_9BACI|nr:MIP/aquaporin family protein [Halalkalibacter krulwichiae]ARK29089.1 Glycerol uptake facilitator protein [Halalkalibacter krulwichiae]
MMPFIGELIGTMILIIFGAGVVAGSVLNKTSSQQGGWIVITFGWGLGLSIAIYAVGGISGAHLNPAVTIGFALIGEFPWTSIAPYILAQLLGAFIGAVLVWLHYYPHWKQTNDKGAKLAVFSTSPSIQHKPSNFFSEVFGTFILVMGLLAIGANDFTEGLNPLIVGLFVVVIGMSLGGTTGYAINPARDLGPRIAHFLLPIDGKGKSGWTYAWVPVIGPIIGGGLGALTYAALFEGVVSSALWIMIVLFMVTLYICIRTERKSQLRLKHVQKSAI